MDSVACRGVPDAATPLAEQALERTGRSKQEVKKRGIAHEAPNPCQGCGKMFFVKGAWSRVKKRVTCSVDCFLDTRRHATRVCSRCHAQRPYYDFARQRTSRSRRHVCTPCYDAGLLESSSGRFLRPSLGQVMHALQRSKAGRTLGVAMTPQEIEQALRQPCNLCGEQASHLDRIRLGVPYQPDNVCPLCVGCHRLVKVMSMARAIEVAKRIVCHSSGKRKGGSANGKQSAKRDPKSGASDAQPGPAPRVQSACAGGRA